MTADLFPANKLNIYPLSEYALTIVFGNEINTNQMSHIRAFEEWLQQNPFTGMYQTVAAYATLSVFFDPLLVFSQKELLGKTAYDRVYQYLQQLYNGFVMPGAMSEPDIITIPVCYGGIFGPDLDYLADCHQLTADETIQRHANAVYEVSMIGFMPGFAYLGGLDVMLATARKSTPRRSVAAGSVGIAGLQTGIYPLESPGGWQIIGRTPLCLFDPDREQPSLLKAGDSVRFRVISAAEFEDFSFSVKSSKRDPEE